MLLTLVLGLAGLWLLCAAFLWAAQERLIFYPDARPLAVPREAESFRLERLTTADGVALGFLAAPPAPGRPVIVLFHGNAGNAADRVALLRPVTAAGYGLVLAEYRGYGGNPGAPSEAGFLADARAHLDWAAARWPDAPLILWGESIGTGVATRMAAERPASGLILDAPYTSVAALAARTAPFLPVRLFLRHPFDSLANVAAIRAPVLLLHGEADGVIPVAQGRRMAAAIAEAGGRVETVVLPGVGHPALYADASGRAMAAVLAFLARLTPA
ncbi:alpha/beta hydrolase [Roseomonas sp. CCTCC AB2023176]|uniref:alpha/beta hydrolase n=1 Tax=Roseomonas sp. CCTCC AB2023176 TaxID=3342640 RepID=UPI0035D811A6